MVHRNIVHRYPYQIVGFRGQSPPVDPTLVGTVGRFPPACSGRHNSLNGGFATILYLLGSIGRHASISSCYCLVKWTRHMSSNMLTIGTEDANTGRLCRVLRPPRVGGTELGSVMPGSNGGMAACVLCRACRTSLMLSFSLEPGSLLSDVSYQ
ncbi:hypothetical protein BDP81DRAFT_221139 [Colletotrichum phormii]|uniref:Uncharacterized protein n=1 Tax=Colletotrichum phormii TaxID=359342 RepID=A0AAI9ZSY2_9PEZI|nr:uncharacterized protein BDP81DRAFT_221139 [Colletotrichum phormii]KAK1637245.1 hypothetical protein BDP81DRAFT_221139 [Colletotrichum phormii]